MTGQSRFPTWDVNQDGQVDYSDVLIVIQHFGQKIAITSGSNPDVNDDGEVNILDLILVGRYFGDVVPIFSLGAKIYPQTGDENPSEDYSVSVNGTAIFVYRARVSAVPFNQVWPGYQRPMDQTEMASFAYWDMSEPVNIEVMPNRPIGSVDIRPYSYDIKPVVGDDKIAFQMHKPGYVTVEVNGYHYALHLFASPVEEDKPNPGDPNLRYFGPGIHETGRIDLKSGETVYIAGGAIVHGLIKASQASGISILGRGILDASMFEREGNPGPISLYGCKNVKIDGIIIRDSNAWAVTPRDCQDLAISNIKLIGFWRYNADGIDIVNSQHVTIDKCFIRSFDDSIAIKGSEGPAGYKPVKDVKVSECVIWNDWGKALEIGGETVAPEISDITFRNCDIIRTVVTAMDILHGDRALIKDISFEDIRFEIDDDTPTPKLQSSRDEKYGLAENEKYCPNLFALVIGETDYSHDEERGQIQNIVFRNISVTGKCLPFSYFVGYDPEHDISDVTIENLRINGKLITNAEEANLYIGDHVSKVRFVEAEIDIKPDDSGFPSGPAHKVEVSNVEDNKGGTYVVSELEDGALFFHDRDYTMTDIPEEYLGLTQIQTSADCPGGQDYRLTFEIDRPAYVYTAWDSRFRRPEHRGQDPAFWFADNYTYMGKTLGLDAKADSDYWIYRSNNPYPKGKVELLGIDETIGDPVLMWTIFLREGDLAPE
ncbi:glycosyl hydrolase family 28 protein [Candidatus Poribacteria bacterium]